MTFRSPTRAGLRSLALAGAALVAGLAHAQAAGLVGLTADNMLVRLDSETRRAGASVRITGAEGRVIGIDQRPADGRLYGVTDAGQIVTIDPATGRATQVSRLSERFEGGGRAVMDFNPVADRLRLMGMNGVNFRINVDTGAVTRDGQLKYQQGSPYAETAPRIVAGAYRDSIAGTQQTALYTIDSLLQQFNLQAPPNDGVQQPRGTLMPALPNGVAFDILADGQGGNTGFLLVGGTLMTINLENGTLSPRGPVAGLPAAEVIDIAAMR